MPFLYLPLLCFCDLVVVVSLVFIGFDLNVFVSGGWLVIIFLEEQTNNNHHLVTHLSSLFLPSKKSFSQKNIVNLKLEIKINIYFILDNKLF